MWLLAQLVSTVGWRRHFQVAFGVFALTSSVGSCGPSDGEVSIDPAWTVIRHGSGHAVWMYAVDSADPDTGEFIWEAARYDDTTATPSTVVTAHGTFDPDWWDRLHEFDNLASVAEFESDDICPDDVRPSDGPDPWYDVLMMSGPGFFGCLSLETSRSIETLRLIELLDEVFREVDSELEASGRVGLHYRP